MPRTPEIDFVEQPLIEQLQAMGWQSLKGDIFVASISERQTFREVLLRSRLSAAIRAINCDPHGQTWVEEQHVQRVLSVLDRISGNSLIEINQKAFDYLVRGVRVELDSAGPNNRPQQIQLIDFEHPERNDFLVINQFRVDRTYGNGYDIPDLVLFVNGIPLVVIECKSPSVANPLGAAIEQLLRYSNQRTWTEQNEGIERLFYFNQLLIATNRLQARVGTIGAGPDQYYEWKDTSPVAMHQVQQELAVAQLNDQHILVAGMLRPAHLLDILHNFIVFSQQGQLSKIAPRYQQFRAVHQTIRRLLTGQTRLETGDYDRRGGIIWHTQGSGKSLTMVFLVRKMRSLAELRAFKVVIVTDRNDLERQLSGTANLIGDVVKTVNNTSELKERLRNDGAEVVFAMIQKYQERQRDLADEVWASQPAAARPLRKVAETPPTYGSSQALGVLNQSSQIIVLIDEAHRSQSSNLHAHLIEALPNSVRIGFTGTPIFAEDRKTTEQIFGSVIDYYTIRQSEADGATVPILYEGRIVDGIIANALTLDQIFDQAFAAKTDAEREAIKRRYATMAALLESQDLIQQKARDMLRHYIQTIMPNGFKAQVVGNSRLAAIRYQAALMQAKHELLAELDQFDPAWLAATTANEAQLDPQQHFWLTALRERTTIERLEAAAVISSAQNDTAEFQRWSNSAQHASLISRFQKPLLHPDPNKSDGLAFLCVRTMLLTGFDAPNEQALYLDRFMENHELLQAIARVNRTAPSKRHGRVIDYYGLGQELVDALAIYTNAETAQSSPIHLLADELPTLRDRHQRVKLLFQTNAIDDLHDLDRIIAVFRDPRLRSEFSSQLKLFLETLDLVLPHPAGLAYSDDARLFGWLHTVIQRHYRENQLNLMGVGAKVRELIDQHVLAKGINPKVPPISILDAQFAQTLDSASASQTQASAMEHAIRHHISEYSAQDPAHYRRLSEQLAALLERFADNWDEQVSALSQLIRSIQAYAQTSYNDSTAVEQRFYGLLHDEVPDYDPTKLTKLTIELVSHIREEVRAIDFWQKPAAQKNLKVWLAGKIDEYDLVPLVAQQKELVSRIIELAHQNHQRLIA